MLCGTDPVKSGTVIHNPHLMPRGRLPLLFPLRHPEKASERRRDTVLQAFRTCSEARGLVLPPPMMSRSLGRMLQLLGDPPLHPSNSTDSTTTAQEGVCTTNARDGVGAHQGCDGDSCRSRITNITGRVRAFAFACVGCALARDRVVLCGERKRQREANMRQSPVAYTRNSGL